MLVVAVATGMPQGAFAASEPTAVNANSMGISAATAQAIAEGRTLFNRNCQMCHNQRGIGGKCPTLVRGAWAPGGPNNSVFMFNTITHGRPGTEMPAWGPILTPEQIRAIVTYLRHESKVIGAEDAKHGQQNDDDDYERRP